MAILHRHIPFYREIFRIPGFLAEPFLMIGNQLIPGDDLPADFDYKDLRQLLLSRGVADVTAIDRFDPRAELRYDLNLPVPSTEEERYCTVCDIGTLEHIFDTRQCLQSCMRMVDLAGYYFLHTPVKGYYGHGFHTFDPELIIQSFRLNGFEIVYLKYSSARGQVVEDPEDAPPSCLIWIVGKKKAPLERFQIPQQRRWAHAFPQASVPQIDLRENSP